MNAHQVRSGTRPEYSESGNQLEVLRKPSTSSSAPIFQNSTFVQITTQALLGRWGTAFPHVISNLLFEFDLKKLLTLRLVSKVPGAYYPNSFLHLKV